VVANLSALAVQNTQQYLAGRRAVVLTPKWCQQLAAMEAAATANSHAGTLTRLLDPVTAEASALRG
jgi:hypothetical protein